MTGDGLARQREHLEAGSVECNEVLFDECLASCEVVVECHLERRANAIVRVEADAVAVAGKYEEEVERALRVAERCEEATVQESVGQMSEASLDATDATRLDRLALEAILFLF